MTLLDVESAQGMLTTYKQPHFELEFPDILKILCAIIHWVGPGIPI